MSTHGSSTPGSTAPATASSPSSSSSVRDALTSDMIKKLGHRILKPVAYVVGPSIANNFVGDASNPKAIISTVLAGSTFNSMRKDRFDEDGNALPTRWERMGTVGRTLGSSAVGLFAVNTLTGGYLEKGSAYGAVAGATVGFVASRRTDLAAGDAKAKTPKAERFEIKDEEDFKDNYESRILGQIEAVVDIKNADEPGSGDAWLEKEYNNGNVGLLKGFAIEHGYSDDLLMRFNSFSGRAYRASARTGYFLNNLNRSQKVSIVTGAVAGVVDAVTDKFNPPTDGAVMTAIGAGSAVLAGKWVADKFRSGKMGTKVALSGALGSIATMNFSDAINLPKTGFNKLNDVLSFAAVGGVLYASGKIGEKWDNADAAERKKMLIVGGAVVGATALAVGGIIAYKHGWIPGVGKHQDKVAQQDTLTGNGSGSGNKGATTIPTPTSRPRSTGSSIPSGGSGSGSRPPVTNAPAGSTSGSGTTVSVPPSSGGRGNGDNTNKIAEIAFKRAAKTQEVLAKARAKQLGLKLTDAQAKKLIEGRFNTLFTGKPRNFATFSNAPAKAQQAFNDFEIRQAAAA